MFTKAIVRTPGESLVNGLSAADLGTPDYKNALHQHQRYIEALEFCGSEFRKLDGGPGCLSLRF